MFGFGVKARQNGAASPQATISPKADVGEIDTRAPFQSVKAAVSLFGEVVSPRSTPHLTKKSKAEERVLEKETQHHIMLRELDGYKDQLRSAETAKAQALRELQRANRTMQELTNKLQTLRESQQASIKATEAAKIRAKQLEEEKLLRAQLGSDTWKLAVESERKSFKACTVELVATKQELANLRRDFDAAVAAKLVLFHKAEDAQHKAQMNQEKQRQLSTEVAALREQLDQVKLASLRSQEEYSRLIAEKELCLLNHKSAKEEAEEEIKRLKEEYEPADNLQEKLEETIEAIKVLQDQLNDIQASDLHSIKTMASELDNAKNELQQVAAEEDALRTSLHSVNLQLEEVKRERSETEHKALEAESTAEQMQADLEKSKTELEAAVSGCSSVMQSSLENLSAEAAKARNEAEDIKKNAELLKQEAEAARIAARETEEKLKVALKEVEAAKAAEKLAEDQIYNYTRSDAVDVKGSGSNKKIRLSVQEFDSMKKKIEEFRNEADVKVATAMAQVETINAREKEASRKLELILKENEGIQSEIKDALKRAEMAEAARRIMQSELQKWRKNEQNVGKPFNSSETK